MEGFAMGGVATVEAKSLVHSSLSFFGRETLIRRLIALFLFNEGRFGGGCRCGRGRRGTTLERVVGILRLVRLRGGFGGCRVIW